MINFLNDLNKPRTYLLIGNVLLVFFLILLNNLKVLPLRAGDFFFFTFLALAFALYRPGWAFLLFIGMIPIENINLAPAELGMNIRPYQFLGALIVLAIVIRLASKRLSFKLAKPAWHDWLVVVFAVSGFPGIINAPDKLSSLKLAVISGTFAVIYFLVRTYIRNTEDLKRTIPFFLSSSMIVVFYGLWQNWAYLHKFPHFETMPGRPNATFTEADWLGLFLTVLSSAICALMFHWNEDKENRKAACPSRSKLCQIASGGSFLYLFLTFIFILLIITVARSAWLGVLTALAVFLFIILTRLRLANWHWRDALMTAVKISSAVLVAFAAIYFYHLTDFQLFNRVQSTGSKLQQITIACVPCTDYGKNECQWKPFPIKEKVIVDENNKLEDYNCRHIDLEERKTELAKGNYISTAFRKDPNINIRAQIYQKSWGEIKKHPISGIGWGSISDILGKDGRGTPLNSSNLFLETWLGTGIIGFLALTILLAYILWKSILNYHYAPDSSQKAASLFMIISWFAIIVPNLFNAGVFMGIFWVWLAAAQLKTTK